MTDFNAYLETLRARERAAFRKAGIIAREAEADPALNRRALAAWAVALAAETAAREAEADMAEAEAGATYLLMHAD